tara:strand:+ start:94 stop:288 length:195 start_codon:yes stop_codon:yes gene_type:complete
MEELIRIFGERYASLSEDEKEIIRGLQGTAEGRVLSKILGPDIMGLIKLKKPVKTVVRRGLGTR